MLQPIDRLESLILVGVAVTVIVGKDGAAVQAPADD